MHAQVREALVEPGQLIERETRQDFRVAQGKGTAGGDDLLDGPARAVEQGDADGIAGRFFPQGLEGGGQDRVAEAAGQVLEVHGELGMDHVKAAGCPGAHCILQARQSQAVIHYVRGSPATCDAF